MLLIIFEVLINVFLCSQANCINATVALSPVQEINKAPYIFLHPPPSPSFSQSNILQLIIFFNRKQVKKKSRRP